MAARAAKPCNPSRCTMSPQNAASPPNRCAQPVMSRGSAEHRAQFREHIRAEKVAPLTDVRFSVRIGEEIPRTVHFNRLPDRIFEYAPQYRGYEYILVGDDIVIVDPRTFRIIAVITG
jgi:hypothetical protein